MRIQEGNPRIFKNSLKIENIPLQVQKLFLNFSLEQNFELKKQTNEYQKVISFFKDKHFIIAGGTGKGLGYAFCLAILSFLSQKGSLIMLSRDLKSSFEFETGKHLCNEAEKKKLKFHWINQSMSLDYEYYSKILNILKTFNAKSCIYINTVASGITGLLPHQKTIYVPDIDEKGLFQYKLLSLNDKQIKKTSFIMGRLAIQFISLLENYSIKVEAAVFSDWRGSLDKISRQPTSKSYGAWGAYSGSLFLPKLIIQKEVIKAFEMRKPWMDIFYPTMETRALFLMPGGFFMRKLYVKLAKKMNFFLPSTPVIALRAFCTIYKNLNDHFFNSFPRLDLHEYPLDSLFHHLNLKINNDPKSYFYYKNWI